jgi:hypothetical protein
VYSSLFVALLILWSAAASAQTAVVTRDVNLRDDPSIDHPAKRLLTSAEPPLTPIEPTTTSGYYHVRTHAGDEGWVWGMNVSVSTSPPNPPPFTPPGPVAIGPGVPGSVGDAGCGDALWHHVYHPARLTVLNDCVTVTGTIVDATTPPARHQPDGVRHEPDGDTHGWLKVDSAFANVINAGNTADEQGNLVFEIVCHFAVLQVDARPSCVGFRDRTTIPAVGSQVAIRGTLVRENNHGQWNEIHPVTSITMR